MTASSVSAALAERVASLTWEALPAEVVAMARRVILDTLGCALQGTTVPEACMLAAVRDDLGGHGPSLVWGMSGGVAPGVAALLNGAHAHLRELDDIGGGGHAGACQVPAVFAAAEMTGGDGRDVILGVVGGHEVSSRLTDAASYDTMTLRGWHTTGVYGSLAAAAAAARTMRLDARGITDALGLAGSFTGGIWAYMADGAMSKRLHPGKSAETGLTAATLARRGVSGPERVLDAEWGGLFETYVPGQATPRAIVKNLDDGFRILRKGFKPFPVCWGINSSADAVFDLRARHDLTAEAVARVRIKMSEMSRRMIGGRRLDSVLDAQMSLRYAVACILLRGRLTLEEFSESALADPATRELMKRVELVVDPAAHGERQTVVIETRDGRALRARVETPRGHWDNPLSDTELRAKFLALATPVLGARGAEAVADIVARLDAPGAFNDLRRCLRPS